MRVLNPSERTAISNGIINGIQVAAVGTISQERALEISKVAQELAARRMAERLIEGVVTNKEEFLMYVEQVLYAATDFASRLYSSPLAALKLVPDFRTEHPKL